MTSERNRFFAREAWMNCLLVTSNDCLKYVEVKRQNRSSFNKPSSICQPQLANSSNCFCLWKYANELNVCSCIVCRWTGFMFDFIPTDARNRSANNAVLFAPGDLSIRNLHSQRLLNLSNHKNGFVARLNLRVFVVCQANEKCQRLELIVITMFNSDSLNKLINLRLDYGEKERFADSKSFRSANNF